MKYFALSLILLLGFSGQLFAIEIGEAQVIKLSASKKRAIIKISKLEFQNAKRLYLSNGIGAAPLILEVVKVKGQHAIVKTMSGEMSKSILYEVFLERPDLAKFKKRQTLEQIEEEKEIQYLDRKKRHYISANTGLMNFTSLVEDGETLETEFSNHFSFGLKYKFRAENDLGFFVEYLSASGKLDYPTLSPDYQISSSFKAYKIGLIFQFEFGGYMQGGLIWQDLSSDYSDEDFELQLSYSGQGYFVGLGYEGMFKASSWFYQFDLCYYLLSYKKMESVINGVSDSEDLQSLKHQATSFLVNFGYAF